METFPIYWKQFPIYQCAHCLLAQNANSKASLLPWSFFLESEASGKSLLAVFNDLSLVSPPAFGSTIPFCHWRGVGIIKGIEKADMIPSQAPRFLPKVNIETTPWPGLADTFSNAAMMISWLRIHPLKVATIKEGSPG